MEICCQAQWWETGVTARHLRYVSPLTPDMLSSWFLLVTRMLTRSYRCTAGKCLCDQDTTLHSHFVHRMLSTTTARYTACQPIAPPAHATHSTPHTAHLTQQVAHSLTHQHWCLSGGVSLHARGTLGSHVLVGHHGVRW